MTTTVDQSYRVTDYPLVPYPEPHKVLIVEDEILIGLDIKARLENAGYMVPEIAASAATAISLAGCYNPDLVLMDIRLRGASDGIEAAMELRQMDIPVVFLTSHSDAETLERARLSEPFGYIVKPFGSVNFCAVIEIALQKHQTERSLRESVKWFSAVEKRRLMRLFSEQEWDAEEDAAENTHVGSSEKIPLEAIPEAIVAFNEAGRIANVNARAARLFGYGQEELLGQRIGIIVPEHSVNSDCDSNNDLPEARGRSSVKEIFCVRKGGGGFRAEINLGSMQTGEGRLLLGCFRDMGDREPGAPGMGGRRVAADMWRKV